MDCTKLPSLTQRETSTETQTVEVPGPSQRSSAAPCLQLVLLWSRHEPQRVGETCAISRSAVLGRKSGQSDDAESRIEFMRQRPGQNEPTGELLVPTLSRRQLLLEPRGQSLRVVNLGKNPLSANGIAVNSCELGVGDTVGVNGAALFLLTLRPRTLPPFGHESFGFGLADPDGIVGESPEAWRLRQELDYLRSSTEHVLILGGSGSGKELCARAVHRSAPPKETQLVARNAATIPSGLVEAELFGNAVNYPHSGLPARAGLIGMAHQSTLFLDEVGELPEQQQANLLRVLDSGEYQRLGEDRSRRSDFRLVAATNRSPEHLKHDFAARFKERLTVPSLNQRRGDIVLLCRGIIAELQRQAGAQLGLSYELADALSRHDYTLDYRELDRLLRLSLRHSSNTELQLTSAVRDELILPQQGSAELSAEAVALVLRESRTASEAATRLGLSSRFALYRLMKKLELEHKFGS